MSNIFDAADPYQSVRADPMVPLPLVPLAATEGGDDADDSVPAASSLDFFLSLGASIGSLTDAITSDRADRTSRQQVPSEVPLFNDGIVPASGTLILDLGAVPQGCVWEVRRLAGGGTTVTTTAAGSLYAFAQGAPPNDLALTGLVDIFTTLPHGDTYGTHQLFLTRGEHLWVAFVGASAAQQYVATAKVEQWAEEAFYSTFTE